ncbi:hypothetical protein GCM10009552_32200 [Rothia nasimurium]|uniref:Uncharacterized protein n=1 Tax=Luteibacter anthropi TaxID=564369 RepID=A0A7X5UCW5_9GAMM|nr:hypothetical protein [Luteibacter anthropi]NII08186.1 hypothetical protein [Luteibacter anthropi]
MIRRIAFTALVLACAACSKPQPPQQDPPKPQAQAAVSVPWQSMEDQKKKAQDVQKVVDKQAEDQRKAIEAQEQ